VIRVTHRIGRSSYVSGGLFAVMFYALFIGPLLFGIWVAVVLGWAFVQLVKLVATTIDHRARRR
jgi:hypothetical protein